LKEILEMAFSDQFNYDQNHLAKIRVVSQVEDDGISLQNLTYQTPFGYRRAAYLLTPLENRPAAAVLYVHWLETWHPTANRRQFLVEAKLISARGAACLLVETLWSDQDWFIKRCQAEDIPNSIHQVVELRVAMDILLSQSGVDPSRLGVVGHDFGGMYGLLAGSVDPRPSCHVIMAATPRFSDWYLYYPHLEEAEQAFYRDQTSPYDPISRVGQLAPAPILFQFGDDDPHVPQPRAEELFDAAGEPKELRWYQAGHGLNSAAAEDRINWLTNQLGLD
jgi:dienelactone hydrolase